MRGNPRNLRNPFNPRFRQGGEDGHARAVERRGEAARVAGRKGRARGPVPMGDGGGDAKDTAEWER